MINPAILREIVAGHLRPKSMSSITPRHSKKSIIINTIVVKMVGGLMAVLLIPIPKTSIATSFKISCLSIFVACTLVGAS